MKSTFISFYRRLPYITSQKYMASLKIFYFSF